ncbi:MAG: hypothetical protein IJ846_02685 [Alphaproteobacteria bacterium]|nr:hypothetical protein [Alphaproteobacteria bacterium]
MEEFLFYEKSYAYLVKEAVKQKLSADDLEKYFKAFSDYDINTEKTTFEAIFERMVISLQNRNMMPSVIKYSSPKYEKILRFFHPADILAEYADGAALFNAMKKEGFSVNDKHSILFERWCNYILSGAEFMMEFKSKENLKNFFNSFQTNSLAKAALPSLIAKEIKGFGFALACDFLKEIGYDYPKPDVHLIDVFKQLYPKEKLDQYNAYKLILKTAEKIDMGNTTCKAYKLDKIIWLCCTHNFYLHQEKSKKEKSFRKEYLKEIGFDELNA